MSVLPEKMATVKLMDEVLPYLPIALAVMTAVVSPALVTARRLRRDLSVDTEMVDRLPTRERAELRKDIQRRAIHLVAISKYPPLTMFDLLAILGFTTVLATFLLGELLPSYRSGDVTSLVDPPTSIGLVLAGGGLCWVAFYAPWAARAAARLQYIEQHLGKEEANDAARTIRLAWATAMTAGLAGVVGLQIATGVIVGQAQGWDLWLEWSVPMMGALAGLALLGQGAVRGALGPDLFRLTWEYDWVMEAEKRRLAEAREAGATESARPE